MPSIRPGSGYDTLSLFVQQSPKRIQDAQFLIAQGAAIGPRQDGAASERLTNNTERAARARQDKAQRRIGGPRRQYEGRARRCNAAMAALA
jgi:hypothetical protein